MQTLIARAHAPRTAILRMLLSLCALLAPIALASSPAAAQIEPVGFVASVRADSVYYRGDTLHVAHTVTNAPTSQQPLWGFALETTAPKPKQNTPPQDWMLHEGPFGGVPSVRWLALGRTKASPGASLPSLDVGAVGIPGVVTFYMIADTPPPQSENPDRETPKDQMLQRSLSGTTVGIVRIPAGATPTSLTTRLRNLLAQSCNELGWVGLQSQAAPNMSVAYSRATANGVRRSVIKSPSSANAVAVPLLATCQSPDAKLAAAHKALVAGATATARDQLTAFTQELASLRASGQINGAGYGLLAGNAAYILNHM